MNGTPSNISDLLAPTGSKHRPVKERIERRLEVLRTWLKEGIPPGKTIPRSLTAAREWLDSELDIENIPSPNDFVKTHHQHGKLVIDVADLLTDLRRRYSRPQKAAKSRKSAPSAIFDHRAIERQLQNAVSQWHSERAQRIQETEKADAERARSLLLLEELGKMEKLNADLRRQLVARKGLKAVE